jgi:hypothetical protein
MSYQMRDILHILFLDQIVHTNNFMPPGNEKIAEVGAQKSCAPRNQRPFHIRPPADILVEI